MASTNLIGFSDEELDTLVKKEQMEADIPESPTQETEELRQLIHSQADMIKELWEQVKQGSKPCQC